MKQDVYFTAVCKRCKKVTDYRVKRGPLAKALSLFVPVKKFWCPNCHRHFLSAGTSAQGHYHM